MRSQAVGSRAEVDMVADPITSSASLQAHYSAAESSPTVAVEATHLAAPAASWVLSPAAYWEVGSRVTATRQAMERQAVMDPPQALEVWVDLLGAS